MERGLLPAVREVQEAGRGEWLRVAATRITLVLEMLRDARRPKKLSSPENQIHIAIAGKIQKRYRQPLFYLKALRCGLSNIIIFLSACPFAKLMKNRKKEYRPYF